MHQGPHMQADIIPNRIQMEKDFIRTAELFIAHNGSVDVSYVMPYVNDFMAANNYGTVEWVTLKNPSMTWNTPEGAKVLSTEVAGWLIDADPANKSYYESRLAEYLAQIDTADLSSDEKKLVAGQDVIVMIWQQDASEKWLGLHTISVFAPEFYQQGKFVPRAVVNDVYNDPAKYRNVRYVIENMQSAEMAKGLEEALRDQKIDVKRVVFTNFPKSLPGVDSLPDVLRYNKQLVMPSSQGAAATSPAATTAAPTQAPRGLLMLPVALGAAFLLIGRRDP
ncbi:MAG: Periplasmic solute binding protein family protein [Methanoregulaceae archaeon PtaB.Bin108]|nr:MAG: Periplasmic solute binding protein family protein [Methanoregulaceae archaeon PtaB.Bin108]OPY46302.1 MAG: Periplasmic solute binding protein family protein [Methanoregulaceae archaeon PtaU1.Bin222]